MHEFDLRKEIVPFVFLKVTQAFREMKVGETLQVTGNDPDTFREIFQVLRTFYYTVVDTKEGDDFYSVQIRKNKKSRCLSARDDSKTDRCRSRVFSNASGLR